MVPGYGVKLAFFEAVVPSSAGFWIHFSVTGGAVADATARRVFQNLGGTEHLPSACPQRRLRPLDPSSTPSVVTNSSFSAICHDMKPYSSLLSLLPFVVGSMAKGRGGGGGSISIDDNWDVPGAIKAGMAFEIICESEISSVGGSC